MEPTNTIIYAIPQAMFSKITGLAKHIICRNKECFEWGSEFGGDKFILLTDKNIEAAKNHVPKKPGRKK